MLSFVMCFCIVSQCTDNKKPPAIVERSFDKIDFAWLYSTGSYGGIVLDSNGHALIYRLFKDSLLTIDTVLSDKLLNQIDSLTNKIPSHFSCLDHLNSDTSTVKCSDSPMAVIQIYSGLKVKTSRCYISVFPGEVRKKPVSPENSILNYFFALHLRTELKAGTEVLTPQSAALDTLLSLRRFPPLLPPVKFTDADEGL
jgi:hypothetical protein